MTDVCRLLCSILSEIFWQERREEGYTTDLVMSQPGIYEDIKLHTPTIVSTTRLLVLPVMMQRDQRCLLGILASLKFSASFWQPNLQMERRYPMAVILTESVLRQIMEADQLNVTFCYVREICCAADDPRDVDKPCSIT